jgi:transketolase|tara:strand:- start:3747 stop:4595 length:849 start_codon:yes stop_codon:yes gene_type:complete
MNNSIELIPSQVRRDILRMVHAVQSGHPGGSMGCTEFFVALYFKLLNHSPEPFNMDGKNEDLFFLSNGHISPVFYSVLARSGYFPVEELNTFRKIDSRLQGHPTTHEGLPGIRVASGSLGQGLSVAIGAAEAKRLSGDKNLVFTLHGDGELQEGQVWEAALYAGSKNIDNIIATIDANGQQIDGSTEEVMAMGDIGLKFEAFGWQVIQIIDGNDLSQVIDGLTSGIKHSGKGKPICIVMKTEMGAGVDFMSGTHKWHGIAPNDEQLENALSQLPETLGDYPL